MKELKVLSKTTEEDWINLKNDITNIVSEEHIKDLEEKTIIDILKHTKGKKVAYGWSAGKDSIVLENVCRKANIDKSILVISSLEYPEFIRWIENNSPDGLEIINTGQDIKWLSENLDMLFPKDSKTLSKWYNIIQHKGQDMFYKKENLDLIIFGRRKKDGNYVGSGTNIYTKSNGMTIYNPLADWKHEDIMGYIYYNNLTLPPIYEYENGYVVGTHSWSARKSSGNINKDWEVIYNIDKNIVEEAAEYIDSAKVFLQSKQG